jgi:choline dehydrogenase-like flavoprotein
MAAEVIHVDVLIVGSGPVGATFARLLTIQLPKAKVLMVDAGPKLTARAGMHVKNISNRGERMRAQLLSQGPPVPGAQGTWSPPGTFLVSPGASNLESAGMPGAAMSTNVGGMGSHWTCACPRPSNAERVPFLEPFEWNRLCTDAETLLQVTNTAFAGSGNSNFIVQNLQRVFGAGFSSDREVGVMPLACTVTRAGERFWSGADVVLGTLAMPGADPDRFELASETLCTQLITGNGAITEAVVCHLPSNTRRIVRARVFIVAADAFRTPQLLWASGIRPKALGHYLNDHPQIVSAVKLSESLVHGVRATGEPVPLGVFWVPFYDPDHPFHGQVMHLSVPGVGEIASLVWFSRKHIRFHDCLEFSGIEKDGYGMPRIHVHYSLTDNDRVSLMQAESEVKAAASMLGPFLEDAYPRILPGGSSLHYQGTTRMGRADDGESVCNTYGQVWGLDNLFVGGNGVIPTATACNPTLSSVALAIRSSERIQLTLQ